jgi:hypothetical protein
MNTPTTNFTFDQRNTRWFPLGDFKGLELSMLAVDRPNKIVDFLIKFHANGVIFPHRHLAETRIFVMQGEHRIYELDGTGEVDCIVMYNLRGNGVDEMFDVLDDAGQAVGKIGFEDFVALYEAQKASV